MKPRATIFLTLAALIIFGCKQEGIVSPELTPGERGVAMDRSTARSEAGKWRPAPAVMKIDPGFYPGEASRTGGVLHIRNQRPVGIITGEMVAAVDSEWSVEIIEATGAGPARGSFTFTVTELFGKPVSGAFVGNALGHFQLPREPGDYRRHTGRYRAQGTGDLEGMTLKGTYVMEPPGFEGHTGPAFTLTQYILDP